MYVAFSSVLHEQVQLIFFSPLDLFLKIYKGPLPLLHQPSCHKPGLPEILASGLLPSPRQPQPLLHFGSNTSYKVLTLLLFHDDLLLRHIIVFSFLAAERGLGAWKLEMTVMEATKHFTSSAFLLSSLGKQGHCHLMCQALPARTASAARLRPIGPSVASKFCIASLRVL